MNAKSLKKMNLEYIFGNGANQENSAHIAKRYKNNSCQEVMYNSQYKKPTKLALVGYKEPTC